MCRPKGTVNSSRVLSNEFCLEGLLRTRFLPPSLPPSLSPFPACGCRVEMFICTSAIRAPTSFFVLVCARRAHALKQKKLKGSNTRTCLDIYVRMSDARARALVLLCLSLVVERKRKGQVLLVGLSPLLVCLCAIVAPPACHRRGVEVVRSAKPSSLK